MVLYEDLRDSLLEISGVSSLRMGWAPSSSQTLMWPLEDSPLCFSVCRDSSACSYGASLSLEGALSVEPPWTRPADLLPSPGSHPTQSKDLSHLAASGSFADTHRDFSFPLVSSSLKFLAFKVLKHRTKICPLCFSKLLGIYLKLSGCISWKRSHLTWRENEVTLNFFHYGGGGKNTPTLWEFWPLKNHPWGESQLLLHHPGVGDCLRIDLHIAPGSPA